MHLFASCACNCNNLSIIKIFADYARKFFLPEKSKKFLATQGFLYYNEHIMIPPKAKKIPKVLTAHGHSRTDDYFWFRERDNPEVLAYIEEENKYADEVMRQTEPLQEILFAEMRARIQEDDMSAPVRIDDYFYYQRVEAGKEYPIFCRKRGGMDTMEEILLDQNMIPSESGFVSIKRVYPSPDHSKIAYSADTDGSERYTLFIKDLDTGEVVLESTPNTFGKLVWTSDSRALFYMTLNDTFRPHKVWKHTLGTPFSVDVLVYTEDDERFFVSLGETRSKKHILIGSDSKTMREVWYMPADGTGAPVLFALRRPDHDYYVEHHGEEFFIMTNRDAKNFSIMRTSETRTGEEHWAPYIAPDEHISLEGIHTFHQHLVIRERKDALARVRIKDIASGAERYIAFDEPIYEIFFGDNPDYFSPSVRLEYSSFITPYTTIDCNMETGEKTIIEKEDVLGGYNPSDFATEVIWCTARDGVRVPITLAYKHGVIKPAPLLLYGYGAYGTIGNPSATAPIFASHRISLLQRGFVVAVAHVRGGGELGEGWHDGARQQKKINTFTDFLDCAEYLAARGYTTKGDIVAYGLSSGGLLAGVVANMRPDLFRAIIAKVPFVDAVTTMLDPKLPLTVNEYDEVGNPNIVSDYEYILSYSPYDNVRHGEYPRMLITTGWSDPRVPYWEPVKWAAKLRAMKTDNNLLVLKTDMGKGHGGASGRYDYLREAAFEYAFILDAFGMTE